MSVHSSKTSRITYPKSDGFGSSPNIRSHTKSASSKRHNETPGNSLTHQFQRSLSLVSRSPERTSSATNIEEDLLTALQCPVCFEYMIPPITLCENGHSICKECKLKFHECPICRRSLMSVRNIALESLARTLLYPCRYSDEGCTEKYSLQEINDHLSICPYRIYDCLLEDSKKCCWKGKLIDFKIHMTTAHSKRVSIFEDNSATCVVWEISYEGCFRDYTHVIFAFGEVFVYKKRFNVEEKKLYFTVQHKGLRSNASKYRYKYKMIKDDERLKFSLSSVVHSEKDDMEAIVLSGQCISVDFTTVVSYGKGKRIFSIMKSKSQQI
ncbi:E3 ubiquitin-protein ligase sina [Anabrus simplex]|uniref:E3 ubiquitin-protein ligase sina n=1 Tax=Anabrus simplex TaxID=316456 RepID=UPI0035A34846